MPRNTDDTRREKLAEEFLAGAGGSGTGPQARPGFQEASLYRIQKRLAGEGEGMTGSRGKRQEERRDLALPHRVRWAVLIPAATLLLMMLFTTGAFAFSLDAEPGSSLYGTKLFFERTRFALTGSTEAKVEYEMELVEKRLEELESMVSRGAQRGGPHWEDAYRKNVDRLYEEIMKLPEQQREDMLASASAILEGQAEAMVSLQAEAPGDLAPCIERARECGTGAAQGMRGQCRQQGAGDGVENAGGDVDGGSDKSNGDDGKGKNSGGGSGGENYCPGRT